jgi:putative hydroxymethylpyrimidine transport system substrate-binding protein
MRPFGRAIKGSRALAAVLAVALLAGCGGGDGSGTDAAQTTVLEPADTSSTTETTETTSAAEAEVKAAKACGVIPHHHIDVALDDWETPEVAGILMAIKRGYFADSGLSVSMLAPPVPGAVIPDVVAGSDAFGVSHEPEAVLAREKGEPIVILGSLVSHPTAAMIWLKKSKISGIADLKGKTIVIPGLFFQERFLETVLATKGLARNDVKVESAANDMVSELVSGRADAIFGRSNLQGAELKARGLDPVVTPVQGLGVPAYNETVLIAQPDCVSRKPEIYRKFLSAVARGATAAIEDPEGLVDALEAEPESNPESGRKAMKAQTTATFPLLSRSGFVSPGQARALVRWMHKEGMINRKLPVSKLLTNAYLRPS